MMYLYQLPAKLNQMDDKGNLALDLALRNKCKEIALTLVKHRADVDRCDARGVCLLHAAIQRGRSIVISNVLVSIIGVTY